MHAFQVERCRHVLHLREKLAEQNKSHELSKLDKEVENQAKAKQNLIKDDEKQKKETANEKIEDKSMEKWEKDEAEKTKRCSSLYIFTTDGDKDKELMAKCLRLILYGRAPTTPPPVRVSFDWSSAPTTPPPVRVKFDWLRGPTTPRPVRVSFDWLRGPTTPRPVRVKFNWSRAQTKLHFLIR